MDLRSGHPSFDGFQLGKCGRANEDVEPVLIGGWAGKEGEDCDAVLEIAMEEK